MKLFLALVALVQLIASCVPPTPSAPPDAQLQPAYRGEASTGVVGDVPWRQLYDDPVLQRLIERALARNFDVELAYTSILEAEANLGITRRKSVHLRQRLPPRAVSGDRRHKPPGTPDPAVLPASGHRGELSGRSLRQARVGDRRGARPAPLDGSGEGHRAGDGRRRRCHRVFSPSRTRRRPRVYPNKPSRSPGTFG